MERKQPSVKEIMEMTPEELIANFGIPKYEKIKRNVDLNEARYYQDWRTKLAAQEKRYQLGDIVNELLNSGVREETIERIERQIKNTIQMKKQEKLSSDKLKTVMIFNIFGS